jgi:hypothetical protein
MTHFTTTTIIKDDIELSKNLFYYVIYNIGI